LDYVAVVGGGSKYLGCIFC